MTKKATLHRASQAILAAHRPLLICHVAPDGDAIGSLTGLAQALRHLEMAPIPACADTIPAGFEYIPGVERVVQRVDQPFDLVVALDCSDRNRLGNLTDLPRFDQYRLVNIDHHITNLEFGDVNLVDAEASSTAEIVLSLVDELDVPLDETLATSLLVGIVTDTRGFRTNNVSSRVLKAALRLMEAGASLPYVSLHGLDRRPMVVVRLWGAALSLLDFSEGVIWTTVPVAMRREVGYQGNGDAGLVSFLLSADEADVSVVFVEQEDGSVDVGLRASPGFNVAQFALKFGGGGHALAAGFSTPGPLGEAERRVLAPLSADVARQRASQSQTSSLE